MGAQIAAHLTNRRRHGVVRPAGQEGNPNGIVTPRRSRTGQAQPAPLPPGLPAHHRGQLRPAEQLRDCDLIIEVSPSAWTGSRNLYKKIAPFVAAHTVLASNTWPGHQQRRSAAEKRHRSRRALLQPAATMHRRADPARHRRDVLEGLNLPTTTWAGAW
jgi:3-hydroxyacyl-CoA dehydrogenase